ncbi:MAG: hypothetical protein H6654_06985 [Ardenticatenaceae bacterium]|nr:hypothetical protein [Ardenticatenaceae bacterium]MCB8973284.1 hypothetical protein [Ardenticatenaceae bacterium]
MKKQVRLALYFGLCVLLLLPATAFAAPLLETESVNLPGWLGGALTALALLMPVFFRLWLKQQK